MADYYVREGPTRHIDDDGEKRLPGTSEMDPLTCTIALERADQMVTNKYDRDGDWGRDCLVNKQRSRRPRAGGVGPQS